MYVIAYLTNMYINKDNEVISKGILFLVKACCRKSPFKKYNKNIHDKLTAAFQLFEKVLDYPYHTALV